MENNNIDKTFNEASKTLEEPATFPGFDKVWAKVEEKLDKKEEKKRKIIPVWIPYGIAASLLIGSGIFYFSNKKENAIVQAHVVAKNINALEMLPVVSEHIQKTDSTVKINIQKEILPPVTIAAEADPIVVTAPFPVVSSSPLASPVHTEQPAVPHTEDQIHEETAKNQNIEEVIAMGIKKEKAAMVNSLAASSSTKKKLTELNAIADTAEAAYQVSAFDLKQATQEPEILAYNKGYLKSKQTVAGNYSGFANKIGNKETVNSLRGAVSGININSISGTSDSGKVNIVINCQGSVAQNNTPIYFIDGKITDWEGFKKLDVNKIEWMTVLKGKKAIELFGAKATAGAMVVETKDISRKEKRKLKRLLKKDLPQK